MSIDDDNYFETLMNNAWRIGNHITGNNEKKVGVIKMKEVKLKEIMNLI